jgi:hypothetical protein
VLLQSYAGLADGGDDAPLLGEGRSLVVRRVGRWRVQAGWRQSHTAATSRSSAARGRGLAQLLRLAAHRQRARVERVQVGVSAEHRLSERDRRS